MGDGMQLPRGSRSEDVVAHPDQRLPSSNPSASPRSSIMPTPPSLSSTRINPSLDESDSELSSVPSDLSDNFSDSELEPAPKKRMIELSNPARRSQKARKPLTKTLDALSSGDKVKNSKIVEWKFSIDKLDELKRILQHNPHGSLPSPPETPKNARKKGSSTGLLDVIALSQKAPASSGKRKQGIGEKSNISSQAPALVEATREATAFVDGPTRSEALHGSSAPDPISDDLIPLIEVSKQLVALSSCAIESKPAPVGKPDVWADGRQALCESLPYYRSYQSAGYCTAGFARSFMFDQEGSPRDYIDSEVVIARSGGGLSRDKITGKMARQADQAEGSQVKSVRNSMEQFHPVAILCGNRNLQSPSKMPHVYNVLDWFKPTQIWFEKVNGMVNIRYRFEKLCKDKPSWWASSRGPEPTGIGDQLPPNIQTCSHCQQPSQQIYLQGWMCLQPVCPQFWKLGSGNEPQEAGLLYDPRFLKQHTPWPHSSAPQPLRPEHFSLGPTPMLGEDVSWAAAKGLVCPKCGRCNSREAWEGWECGSATCDFSYSLPHANVPPQALHDIYNPVASGYATSRDLFSPILPLQVKFAHNYRINYFTIPGMEGFVAHFIANKTINEEPGGPDDMWTEMQTADLGLRRRPLGCSTLQGPMLTQHFCVNYGMPYKFIAATASRDFKDAAQAINTTRSHLNWAARHCVGPERHKPETGFNELLALGYFERQKIDYHDDGEYGLGPTIATLSLGAPASMKVRLKAKHHNGVSKGGAYVNRPPVPGCFKYEARKTAHDELERLKLEDGEAYRARLKSLPSELGLQTKGNAKDVLNMHLGHGDIVVMHGAKIQEYYEHAVDPVGKLRFALTCRYIDPESLKPEDRPVYEVKPDTGEYDDSRLPAVAC